MKDNSNPRPERITKGVRLTLDEKRPDPMPTRPSRLVDKAGAAGVRLRVEELLASHHGFDAETIRGLTEDERNVLYRMVIDPAARDYPNRREAVSAIAVLGDVESALTLAALTADPNEDEVIIGRALDGLAMLGNRGALKLILEHLESRRPHVRDRAVRALIRLRHPDSTEALRLIAETHPSDLFRRQSTEILAEWGIEVKSFKPDFNFRPTEIVPETDSAQ